MKTLGISSACFYPQTTEVSFRKLCENNIKTVELFYNSPSELNISFTNEIIKLKNEFGVSIPSVHPFMSFAESFFLFSSYERRFYDILDLYRSFFETMQMLDSKIFILHGAKIPGSIPDELYFERFKKLIDIGKEYNVSVCQENVVNYRSEAPEFICKMKNCLGDDFSFVLDIKQALRAAYSPYDFINIASENLKHIHISDHNEFRTCIPPLEGNFDFDEFFSRLRSFDGNFIIELYDNSYNDESQIYQSYEKLSKLLVDY